jgi:hypothetical protein
MYNIITIIIIIAVKINITSSITNLGKFIIIIINITNQNIIIIQAFNSQYLTTISHYYNRYLIYFSLVYMVIIFITSISNP